MELTAVPLTKGAAAIDAGITQEEFTKRYAERLKKQTGCDGNFAQAAADVAWDEFLDSGDFDDTPEDLADEEISYWD
ncbi:hypothetical protein ACJJIU_22210 (plasmid) [Microbulbifer sp. CnH-101-E]|uniref:hypothetical protein n=1 Tax=unclassified Microbulbifer TaxID=2619833 RepID=UPI0040392742